LISYTVVLLPFPGQPKNPPYVYGMIKFDGTNTDFPHLIEVEDIKKGPNYVNNFVKRVKPGCRVKVVWNEIRNGDLYDIKYFVPVESS
jgi:uncharacterized OB-fold protein